MMGSPSTVGVTCIEAEGELAPELRRDGHVVSLVPTPGLLTNLRARALTAHFRRVRPHVVHVHGKFYRVVGGAEPSIDYPAVLGVLREHGYRGFISSEYEAHAYTDRYSAWDQLRAHHDLCRRLLEGTPVPAVG